MRDTNFRLDGNDFRVLQNGSVVSGGRSSRKFPIGMLLYLGWTLLTGCSSSFKPYAPPSVQVLQDPLPGSAVVYLLRAPYDDIKLEVLVGGEPVAELAESTYTVLSLKPGSQVLTTNGVHTFGSKSEAAPPFVFSVSQGQRRFFNVSAAMTRTISVFGGVPIVGTGVASNSRSWKEVSEMDAQGLMSISRLVLPAKAVREPSAAR